MTKPYTKRRAAQYRGPSTSDDYNKRIEENYQDLVVLLNNARVADVELDELYRRMVKDNLSLARLLNDLEVRMATIEAAANRLTFYSADQIDNDYFIGSTYEVPTDDRCSYDLQHGILTLPEVTASSLSKLLFTNVEGKEIAPPSLEMRVVPNTLTADNPGDANTFVDSSAPQYALYRAPGLIWERNVVVDAPHLDGAELQLYVKIPTDLSTTANSNNLIVHPFPHFGTTIKEIAYSVNPDPLLRDSDGYEPFNPAGHYAGEEAAKGWVVPGGWTDANEGEDAAINTGPRMYNFSPKPITALRITLHQATYYQEAGKYIYSYGLSHLDLRFNKFLKEGTAIIRFDAPAGQTISDIVDIQPEIWNVHPAELSNVFSYKVIWETSFGSGNYTETPVSNSDRAWIEVTLKNTDSWTPALSGLIVDYV